MRGAFIKKLVSLAGQDPRILLLTGDLGYLALEPFAEKFPERFFNVGVAEQNMMGLATGLAEAGFIPFVYSITPFAVLRPYEFIRNGPVLHRLPVRIVGIGGGFEYGSNGFSHYGLEDIAALRALPGLNIVAPADYQQAQAALECTWNMPGPVYYRLGKDEHRLVSGLNGNFEPGKLQILSDAGELALIALGGVAQQAVLAAQRLTAAGLKVSVAVFASVCPAPEQDLARFLQGKKLVLTVEAHYAAGGLGSIVAEAIAERALPCRLVRCAVRALPAGQTGSEAWLHQAHGLSAEKIVETALTQWNPGGLK